MMNHIFVLTAISLPGLLLSLSFYKLVNSMALV